MTHQDFVKLVPDYVDDLLNDQEKKAFEAHLQTCPQCRSAVASLRAMRQGLRQHTEAHLSDEARLRLYEKFNEERQRRGESLLRIPADLVARVKAKAAATPEAARLAATGSKEASAIAASSGVHLAKTTGRGSKQLGRKMKQSAEHSVQHAAEVAKEMGKTVADVGRITTIESFEILQEAPQHKRKAILAPAKLMGQGLKAGMRMMTGAAKTAAKSMKGGAVMTRDAAETMATGMIESARVGKAMAESADKMKQAGQTLSQSFKEAGRRLIEEDDAPTKDA